MFKSNIEMIRLFVFICQNLICKKVGTSLFKKYNSRDYLWEVIISTSLIDMRN